MLTAIGAAAYLALRPTLIRIAVDLSETSHVRIAEGIEALFKEQSFRFRIQPVLKEDAAAVTEALRRGDVDLAFARPLQTIESGRSIQFCEKTIWLSGQQRIHEQTVGSANCKISLATRLQLSMIS